MYINDFLRHSTVSSTEIYATPDSKKQREEILKNSKSIKTKNKYSNKKKDNLDNWLKNNMKQKNYVELFKIETLYFQGVFINLPHN